MQVKFVTYLPDKDGVRSPQGEIVVSKSIRTFDADCVDYRKLRAYDKEDLDRKLTAGDFDSWWIISDFPDEKDFEFLVVKMRRGENWEVVISCDTMYIINNQGKTTDHIRCFI